MKSLEVMFFVLFFVLGGLSGCIGLSLYPIMSTPVDFIFVETFLMIAFAGVFMSIYLPLRGHLHTQKEIEKLIEEKLEKLYGIPDSKLRDAAYKAVEFSGPKEMVDDSQNSSDR